MTLDQVLRRYRPTGQESGMDDAMAVDMLLRAHHWLTLEPVQAMLALGRLVGVDFDALHAAASGHAPFEHLNRKYDA